MRQRAAYELGLILGRHLMVFYIYDILILSSIWWQHHNCCLQYSFLTIIISTIFVIVVITEYRYVNRSMMSSRTLCAPHTVLFEMCGQVFARKSLVHVKGWTALTFRPSWPPFQPNMMKVPYSVVLYFYMPNLTYVSGRCTCVLKMKFLGEAFQRLKSQWDRQT